MNYDVDFLSTLFALVALGFAAFLLLVVMYLEARERRHWRRKDEQDQ